MGIFVLKYPPAKINTIYGYRTKRSMQSQESWDFAQTYSTKLMVDAAKFITFMGVLAVSVNIMPEAGALLGTMIILAALAYPFVRTETALKDKFKS